MKKEGKHFDKRRKIISIEEKGNFSKKRELKNKNNEQVELKIKILIIGKEKKYLLKVKKTRIWTRD